MSGRQQNHHRAFSKPRSKTLFIIFLFCIPLLIILYTFYSSARPSISYRNPSDHPETSFVTSLEHFLIHKAPKLSLPVRDDTARGESDVDDARKLDELVFARENRWLNENPGYPVEFPIKVYVYEMPKKFTLDLLWLFHNTYKETSNATSNGSPVHRLIEQVLLVLLGLILLSEICDQAFCGFCSHVSFFLLVARITWLSFLCYSILLTIGYGLI